MVLANQLNVINWVVNAYAIIDYFGRKYPNSRVFFLPILPRLKPLDNVEGLEFYIGKSEVYYEAFKNQARVLDRILDVVLKQFGSKRFFVGPEFSVGLTDTYTNVSKNLSADLIHFSEPGKRWYCEKLAETFRL